MALLTACPSLLGTGNGDDATAPAAVESLSASAGEGQVTVTWTDPESDRLERVPVAACPVRGC